MSVKEFIKRTLIVLSFVGAIFYIIYLSVLGKP